MWLVFNEFLILFCCGLEHDTHQQVTTRDINESQIEPLFEDEEEASIVCGKSHYTIELKKPKE